MRLLGRVRAERVSYAPVGGYAGTGRPGRHGPAMRLDDPTTWPPPAQAVTSTHERYGAVAVTAWGHYHPVLQRRAGWATHVGPLPLVEGSVILVRVDRLPGDRDPRPVWLWHSHPQVADLDALRLFHAFLRASTLNTRSGFSSRPWAGPAPASVTPTKPTGGPG